MHRLFVITALLLALAATGCDRDEGADPRPDSTPAVETASTRTLARLQRSLDDRYAVTAIAPADLPRTEALFTPSRAQETPSKLTPIDGLRAELADGTTGHVYRYETEDLAQLAAPSLLRRDLFFGVQGCGRTVFFSGSDGGAGKRWLADVAAALDCDAGFAAIE
jgi:hypothetical protein